jgi:DNA-binding response OmpR family regulator
MDTQGTDSLGVAEPPATISLTVRIVLSGNDTAAADRLVAGLRDLGGVVVDRPAVPVLPQQRRPAVTPPLCLYPDRVLAVLDGVELSLTRLEFRLLSFFVNNPGRAYTRDEILAEVWGDDRLCGSRTVDVHVRRLRVKLREIGPQIRTVRGVGYRLDRSDRALVVDAQPAALTA